MELEQYAALPPYRRQQTVTEPGTWIERVDLDVQPPASLTMTFSDGLHQAVEAKEGVKIERENQTLATITFQNYFRNIISSPA